MSLSGLLAIAHYQENEDGMLAELDEAVRQRTTEETFNAYSLEKDDSRAILQLSPIHYQRMLERNDPQEKPRAFKAIYEQVVHRVTYSTKIFVNAEQTEVETPGGKIPSYGVDTVTLRNT